MAKLVCLNCSKTFDLVTGHNCEKDWRTLGDSNENTANEDGLEELDDILKKGPTHEACAQINETTSVGNELTNVNLEFFHEHVLSNQGIYGNDQPTYLRQECSRGDASNNLMVLNSEQGRIGERAIDGLKEQVRTEQGTKDWNMLNGIDFQNRGMESNIDGLTSIVHQLALDEGNLNTTSISNLSNSMPDFSTVSGSINNMEKYKFPTLDAFEDVQTQTKIQSEHSNFINYLVKGSHCYDISSTIDDIPVINDQGRENPDFIMGNTTDCETAIDSNRLSEMHHQLSKYGQNTRGILMKGDLESWSNNFGVMLPEPSRHLVLSDIPTHVSSERTGSINDQAGRNRTNAEMMRHKGTNVTTESNIGLNDTNFSTVTEGSAEIGISCTQRSDPFDNCSVDDALATAAASFSHLKDRHSSAVFKEFQSNSNVKRHSVLQKRHFKNGITLRKGKKQYKCDFCQKPFKHMGNFKNHVLIHTGEKPFQCKACGKSFNQNGNLKRHALIHKDEKPIQCDVCGILFRQMVTFQRHVLTHSGEKPFKCKECGKSFTQKSHLHQHAFIHTGEKPHKCLICGKKFSHKSNLNKHTKTHKGN